ncbi:MAG: Ger(x)C family spore germination protein [Clostridiales bacterium]|nr:Ger(x)C family spore germination protein [Clostridiales bacterium]
MKIKAVISLLLMLSLCLSSCSYSETELKNRLIIEGIGIDCSSGEDIYTLTVQTLLTVQSEDSESSAEGSAVNYTVSGNTVDEALSSLREITGKNPLYSQNRVIVMGSDVTGGKFTDALDFFAKNSESRADVYVAAASGKAADILAFSDENGEITSELIEQAIEEGHKNSFSVDTELYNIVNLNSEKTTAFTIPLLEISEDGSGSKHVKVTGTYVYTENGNTDNLSKDETMFFLMVTGNAEKGTVSITSDGISAGLDITKCSSKIKVKTADGKPYFEITVKCTANVTEYEDSIFTDYTKLNTDKIAEDAANYIRDGINELLTRQLKEEKCDIFRFGKYLMREDFEAYISFSENQSEALAEAAWDLNVSVKIKN